MNQNTRLADYLQHMLDAVRLARAYTEGMEKPDFIADKRTQQAVILNLLTLGEAAAHIERLNPLFPEQHPQLPWKQMRGMRNRLAHGYFDINLDVVWDTLLQDLPPLEQSIATLIEAL